jgi:monoamine oxidase
LADRFGIRLFESGGDGKFLCYLGGTVGAFDFEKTGKLGIRAARPLRPILRGLLTLVSRWIHLPMEPAVLVEIAGALRELDLLAATVPCGTPWTAPDAAALDQRTIGSWLGETVRNAQARQVVESLFGYFPSTTSLLFVLHLLNTWGGIGPLMSGQTSVLRFADGAQSLSLALAKELGERVVLGSPVLAIERDAGGVRVHTSDAVHEASRAVVAVGPAACRHIDFRPGLPEATTLLHEAWQPVHGRKINAVYDEPFWRAAGLSGSALTDLDAAPGVLDASPPDGTVGVLACYATGDATASSAQVLDSFAAMFGPKALKPIGYSEKVWRDEPYSFGCEGGLGASALTTARALLKAPAGPVHWAGVETADEWMGFMNGAVQAGERAAREVLAAR